MILQNRVLCMKQYKAVISQVLSEVEALLLSFFAINIAAKAPSCAPGLCWVRWWV